MIKFSQNAWRNPCTDMNTDLRKKEKNDFEKDFFQVDQKRNVRKHRDIKLVTTERSRSYLVPEPNNQITKFFTENLLVIEMKKRRYL